MEIEGTQTKGGDSHSYSKEPVWDKVAEDGELRPREEEQEQETPPQEEEIQQA